MKTFRLIGMAILAVVMSMNLVSCGDDDDSTEISEENLGQLIIGTWIQDGDDDVIVIKSDGTVTWYADTTYYENNIIDGVYEYQLTPGIWRLNMYYNGELEFELRPHEIFENVIVWKKYHGGNTGEHDGYGYYSFWTWERYNK